MRQISAFDLDHTLISGNSSVLFLRYLIKKKQCSYLRALPPVITYLLHRLHFLSLSQLYKSAFFFIFKEKNLLEITQTAQAFVKEILPPLLIPETKALWKEAKQRGDLLLLLSSSPNFIVEPFAHLMGADGALGSSFGIDKDGKVCTIASVIDGQSKADTLEKWAIKHKILRQRTVAYSDSILDLKFLQAAGSCVAVSPDRKLKKICNAFGWNVINLRR